MEFVPLVVLTALIKKIVDTIKYAVAGDVNAVATQIVAWLAGIGVAFLGANSDWANQMQIGGLPLDALNNWSIVLAGINLASTAGLAWDAIKAIDNDNSAAVPNLLAPHSRHDTTPT
jgi:hypothetical protein